MRCGNCAYSIRTAVIKTVTSYFRADVTDIDSAVIDGWSIKIEIPIIDAMFWNFLNKL